MMIHINTTWRSNVVLPSWNCPRHPPPAGTSSPPAPPPAPPPATPPGPLPAPSSALPMRNDEHAVNIENYKGGCVCWSQCVFNCWFCKAVLYVVNAVGAWEVRTAYLRLRHLFRCISKKMLKNPKNPDEPNRKPNENLGKVYNLRRARRQRPSTNTILCRYLR